MSHTLFIERSARKELGKIPKPDREKIVAAIKALGSDPHPAGSKKLIGREAWRVRVGSYIRVIYEINDDRLIILVVKVGHRQGVYSRQ